MSRSKANISKDDMTRDEISINRDTGHKLEVYDESGILLVTLWVAELTLGQVNIDIEFHNRQIKRILGWRNGKPLLDQDEPETPPVILALQSAQVICLQSGVKTLTLSRGFHENS